MRTRPAPEISNLPARLAGLLLLASLARARVVPGWLAGGCKGGHDVLELFFDEFFRLSGMRSRNIGDTLPCRYTVPGMLHPAESGPRGLGA